MKALIETVCILAAFAASAAFDSEEWLAKREMLSLEAERLRVAFTNCAAQVKDPAEDITVPLETFPDGSVKSSIHAKRAMLFLDTGLVWAEDVTVQKRDEAGRVVSQIDAKNCVVDRMTKSGWADGPAKITHGSTVFEGEGVYFSSPEAYVMVKRRSKIVSKDLTFGGVQ